MDNLIGKLTKHTKKDEDDDEDEDAYEQNFEDDIEDMFMGNHKHPHS